MPSLRATGEDTAALADSLGLEDYAVLGLSGGGPFAVATAIADPGRVRAVGVVGGAGPWRELDDSTRFPDDRAQLALLDAGDIEGAWAGIRGSVDEEIAEWRDLDPEALVDAILAEPDSPPSPLLNIPEY